MASKKVKYDADFETKFSLMRIECRTSTVFRESIKLWFKHENELLI